MISRMTSAGQSQAMLARLSDARQSLSQSQQQIASGKRIESVSDAPADAVAAMDHRARLARVNQLSRNADAGSTWLNQVDQALTSVNTQLVTARTSVVQAASGANDAVARQAVANQLLAIRDALLGTANTSLGGRPVFGGTSSSPVAYDASGTYQGDGGQVTMPVAPGVTMTLNATGPAVFGTANPGDPANGDVFQLLTTLAAAANAGDTTTLNTGLTRLDAAISRAQTVQAQVGARAKQLEDLQEASKLSVQQLSSSISKLEDVDIAQATIEMKNRELAYQAALQVSARVIQSSLMDFLRP